MAFCFQVIYTQSLSVTLMQNGIGCSTFTFIPLVEVTCNGWDGRKNYFLQGFCYDEIN